MSEFTDAFTAQMMAIDAVNTGNGFTAGHAEFMVKLQEEVGEVADAMIDGERGALTFELADVMITVMFYAAQNKLDLAQAIEQKNLINSRRGYRHGKG